MTERLILLAVLYIVADVYAYRGVFRIMQAEKLQSIRKYALVLYWLADVLLIVFALVYGFIITRDQVDVYITYRRFFWIIGAFMLVLLPKAALMIFVLLNDLKNVFITGWLKWMKPKESCMQRLQKTRQGIGLLIAGLVVSGWLFLHTFLGIVHGRFAFEVVNQDIYFKNLPAAFHGFRLVHISDTHLGSFVRTEPVNRGVGLIEALQPDMVVLTGDMVNNHAGEAEKFITIFNRLQPPKGMFAVLGNHDLGDYRTWGTIQKPEPDIEALVRVQQQMGFTTLLNEHRFVRIGNDSIMIAGVKNWGKPPFQQFGDLNKALGGYSDFPFIILLSHDTSHWRAEVVPGPDIDLTLSGHTHGMQFGFHNRWFSWSPIKWLYPEWNGLYREGQEQLYVNRGFGFLSFPGRAGMPPEITLITLKRGTKPD